MTSFMMLNFCDLTSEHTKKETEYYKGIVDQGGDLHLESGPRVEYVFNKSFWKSISAIRADIEWLSNLDSENSNEINDAKELISQLILDIKTNEDILREEDVEFAAHVKFSNNRISKAEIFDIYTNELTTRILKEVFLKRLNAKESLLLFPNDDSNYYQTLRDTDEAYRELSRAISEREEDVLGAIERY